MGSSDPRAPSNLREVKTVEGNDFQKAMNVLLPILFKEEFKPYIGIHEVH